MIMLKFKNILLGIFISCLFVGTAFASNKSPNNLQWMNIPVAGGFTTSQIAKNTIGLYEDTGYYQVLFRGKLNKKFKDKFKRELGLKTDPVYLYQKFVLDYDSEMYCAVDQYLVDRNDKILHEQHTRNCLSFNESTLVRNIALKVAKVVTE